MRNEVAQVVNNLSVIEEDEEYVLVKIQDIQHGKKIHASSIGNSTTVGVIKLIVIGAVVTASWHIQRRTGWRSWTEMHGKGSFLFEVKSR